MSRHGHKEIERLKRAAAKMKVPDASSSFEDLVARCGGDRGVAESLVGYDQMTYHGTLTREDAIKRALSRPTP